MGSVLDKTAQVIIQAREGVEEAVVKTKTRYLTEDFKEEHQGGEAEGGDEVDVARGEEGDKDSDSSVSTISVRLKKWHDLTATYVYHRFVLEQFWPEEEEEVLEGFFLGFIFYVFSTALHDPRTAMEIAVEYEKLFIHRFKNI